MGAESIQKLMENFDIEAEAESLRETIRSGKGQKKLRALKRLKVVAAFQQSGNSPMGMVLDAVPVIPPELRPMVQLDGVVSRRPTSTTCTAASSTATTASSG